MAEIREIDLTEMRCPLPLVHLNKVIQEIAAGEELIAVASDRAFALDVEAWCKMTGNTLVKLDREGAHTRAVIRKNQK